MNKISVWLGASLLLVAQAAHATETEPVTEKDIASEAAAEKPAKARAKYPMKATEFKTKVDANIHRAKARLESKLKDPKMTAARIKDARARFDRSVVEVRKVVDKVSKDGAVTRDEAKEVKVKSKAFRAVLRTRA